MGLAQHGPSSHADDELWSRMWEVDEPTAIDLLISLEISSVWDRSRRARRLRRYQDEPRDVFEKMVRLTGPGTRWWTNIDLTRWNPVTQHTSTPWSSARATALS